MKTTILNLITNNALACKEIADQLGVKIQQITGLIPSLKKEGAVYENGKLLLVKKEETRGRGRPVNADSKQQKAIALFDKMVDAARKDIIAAFQTELNLTKNGAATYYQNIKKAKGLVKSKE